MALSIIGTPAAVAATSITLPTHAVGDIIVLFVYRDGSNTQPTTPTASGTVPAWNLIDGAGANTNSSKCVWFKATATNHTSGTWTNATGIGAIVIRGQHVSSPIGGHAQTTGSASNTTSAPSITLSKTDGTSMILEFYGHRTVTAWSSAPSGYTRQASVSTEVAINTKDTTTSDGSISQAATTSSSSGYAGQTVEIIIANSAPTLTADSPADTASFSDTTPAIKVTGSDVDSDTLTYEVQVDTVNTFDSQTGLATPTAINRMAANSTTGASSYATGSLTPASNKLILLTVVSRTGITANPNQPTVTGNGLTWVAIDGVVFDDTSSSRRRITVFRAMGSSPTAGAITIDFAGQSQTDCNWSVDEVTGADTSGTNGSGAIVQHGTNFSDTGSLQVTVTLSAFGDSHNATFGAAGTGLTNATIEASGGWSQLSNQVDGNSTGAATAFNSGNDTTVTFNQGGGGAEFGVVGIEIKAGSASGTPLIDALSNNSDDYTNLTSTPGTHLGINLGNDQVGGNSYLTMQNALDLALITSGIMGTTKVRLALPSYNDSTGITNMRALVAACKAVGLDPSYGITGLSSSNDATSYAAWLAQVDTEAAWASANSVSTFYIGNEEDWQAQLSNFGTITDTQVRTDVFSKAASLKASYPSMRIVYSTAQGTVTQWNARTSPTITGSSLDGLGFNMYDTLANFAPNITFFTSQIGSKYFVSEWASNHPYKDMVSNYGYTDATYRSDLASRAQTLKTSGLESYFFSMGYGSNTDTTTDWNIRKSDGTFKPGFSGVFGVNVDPFTAGNQVQYNVPAARALAPGTYYWRARVADPLGTNTNSSWTTVRSFTVTSGSNVTLAPGAVSLTTTASHPTVTATNNKRFAPGLAAIVITLLAPVILATANKHIAPGAAALSTTAAAPTLTLTQYKGVRPGAASLVISPSAPSITATANKHIVPGSLSLSITASAPTVTASGNKTLAPSAASLAITPHAASISTSGNTVVHPGSASLAITPAAPSISATDNKHYAPSAASLAITPAAPTTTLTQYKAVRPSAATLILTPATPAIIATNNKHYAPSAASLTISVATPTVLETTGVYIHVPAGSTTITGGTPAWTLTGHKYLHIGAASLVIGLPIPTVSHSDNTYYAPSPSNLTLSGAVAAVAATDNKRATPGHDSLSIALSAPTVSATDNKHYAPGAASLVITGAELFFTQDYHFSPAPAILPITGSPIALALTQYIGVQPGSTSLTIDASAPTVVIVYSSRTCFVWSGTAWVLAQPYVWNGSVWARCVPERWDGEDWEAL